MPEKESKDVVVAVEEVDVSVLTVVMESVESWETSAAGLSLKLILDMPADCGLRSVGDRFLRKSR